MNIFKKIAMQESRAAFCLGTPAADEGAHDRRMNAMAMLNPKGFRTPPKTPKRDAQGRTRGERKELARQSMVAKIKQVTIHA